MLLRSALFNALFLLTAAITSVVGLLLPTTAARRFVRGWARLVLRLLRATCGIRVRVTGLEHLPEGACILAAKHQSAFDTVIWLAVLDRPVYVMKAELLRIPVWGRTARRFGAIGVDRAAGATALKAMVRDARAQVAERQVQVVIFPEGTRTAPGERVPWQPGVAALAGATGLPVVGAATDSGLRWGRASFRKRPGTVHVAILPPLPVGLARAELMRRLESSVEEASTQLLAGHVDKSVDELRSEIATAAQDSGSRP